MPVLNVKQNQIKVVALDEEDINLISNGVSTCICLLAKGYVGNMPYLALYHWDGFDTSFDKSAPDVLELAQMEIESLIAGFSNKIACEMEDYENDSDDLPFLSELYLIGGQKDDEIASGTELEVESLRLHAETACQKNFNTTDQTKYTRSHYTTSGMDDLSICFSATELLVQSNEHFDYDSSLDEDCDIESDDEATVVSYFSR